MEKERKKRGKLSRRIIYLIAVSMTSVSIFVILIVAGLNWLEDKDFYNTKTMQIATTTAERVDEVFVEKLYKAITTEEYQKIYEAAVEAADAQPVINWLKDNGLYEDFCETVDQLTAIQQKMDVRYMYIQRIEGMNCITLIDPTDPYLSLGMVENLEGGKFEGLGGNVVVKPTVTYSEYGWLSSAGAPVTIEDGTPIAIAFCDLDATDVFTFTKRFIIVNAIILAVITFLAVVFSSRVIRKRISMPIEMLTAETERFGDDESGYVKENIANLKINTGDEIEELYNATRFMQESIIDYMDNLTQVTAEKERIGAELDVATRIQASMLPSIFPAFPDRNEFDIYASMKPAKEVGGDFYDFFLIDDDHLGLVIADVSGKGVPAALFMMMSKIIIANYAHMGMSPAEVLEKTNNSICANNQEDMFVTVWFGVLTISTGHIIAGNAGHEYPMIKKKDGKFEIFEDRHDFVIGGMEDMPYSEYEFDLEKGGTLFVYSDGCPEATDVNDELFGTDRMLQALNENPDAQPREILENMKKAVNKFVGTAPQFDDLTMLAIKLL